MTLVMRSSAFVKRCSQDVSHGVTFCIALEHGVAYGMVWHAVKAGLGPAAAHSVSFAHSAAAGRGRALIGCSFLSYFSLVVSWCSFRDLV